MTALVEGFDAVLFDLDGVLYIGPEAVPSAPAAVAGVRAASRAVGFVTNNASRSPQAVADALTRLGIPASAGDVVTSAQAVCQELASRFPAGSRVLVVGADALADEVDAVGLVPTRDPDDGAVAVVQGYNPAWRVRDLQDCCQAVHAGLPWFASNDDLTIPTDRGIMPGMGSWIQVVGNATNREPDVIAGKPHRPLLDMTVRRLGCTRPLFVGDRLDTDVEGANAVGMASLFVLATGAHHKRDLLVAPPEQRPTYLGLDAAALLQPGIAIPAVPGPGVGLDGDVVVLPHVPTDATGQLKALADVCALTWSRPGLDATAALERLDLLP